LGEVWVCGHSVAQGYWGEDLLSRELFQAKLSGAAAGKAYLKTGDQGFLHEGELYVTGRIRDLMVVNGRNLYPEDVERIAGGAHPALRTGKGAAFSVQMEGVERYVVAHEMEFGGGWNREAVAEGVRRALTGALGIGPGAIVLVKAGAIPRTSSGKVRRQVCKQMFLAQELACG
jgi:acyl-CoA synthetase (AMP-forming)/AMP-acid ligase II